MWAFLALKTVGSAPVPPLLLNVICFAIGSGSRIDRASLTFADRTFSSLLPGETLRRGHMLGAIIAFAGAALIAGNGDNLSFDGTPLDGNGLALLCALTWSTYSFASHKIGNVPTSSVSVFCLVSAILSALLHLALEATIWPENPFGWL